jgi:hypothetical protein
MLMIIASSAAAAPSGQASAGQIVNDTGTFSVKHTELNVAAANQNGSSSPCLGWGSTDCLASNGLSAGQWFLLVELQLNAVTKSTATYTVSVQVESNDTDLQPIEFVVTNSTVSGSLGDFCWNLGPSFNTPFAFTVTVA